MSPPFETAVGLWFLKELFKCSHSCTYITKIVAAFRGMHVSPAKHSYASVTDGQTDTDRQTDGQTDDGQSDPYVSLCFAGDTKSKIKNVTHIIPKELSDWSGQYVCRMRTATAFCLVGNAQCSLKRQRQYFDDTQFVIFQFHRAG